MQRFTTPLLLAYSAENEELVQQITKRLKNVLDFKYAKIERDQEESLTALCNGYEGPVLLFVTDNFLRSTKCMESGLNMLNDHQQQLLPVVMPGYRLQEDGSREEVRTSFERVSDIIQYINFWQDRYLDLRRQKREDPSLNTPGFEEHLKVVRSISGEAGEYLRHLRSMEHLSVEEFKHNDYQLLFEFLDAESIGEQLKTIPNEEEEIVQSATAEKPVEEPESLEDTPEQPEEEHIAEKEPKIDSPVEDTTADEEEPPIDLSGIPGVELLDNDAEEPEIAHEKELEPHPEEPVAEEQDEEQEEQESNGEKEQEQIEHLVSKAWRLADDGDLSSASTLLSAGLEELPHSSLLQYNYALLLAQQDRLAEAKDATDDLLEKNPEHEKGLFLAAELADMDGNPETAQQYLVKLVRLKDQGPAVWHKLGVLSLEKKPANPAEAERYLKEATKHKDCPPETFYELGLVYNNYLGKPKKALKYFEETRERQPNHPFVNYDIATLLHKKGKQKRAHQAYMRAIEVNPEVQTSENDAAFAPPAKNEERVQEQHTLEALKDNVERLEALIQQRDEQEAARSEQKSGTGKTVLITGATSGIGRATAEKYAANGFRLIITGRRKERLEELQAEWSEAYGIEVHCLQFDVRDADAVKAALGSLPDAWFDIDLLINNAGKAKGFDPIHEGQLVHWEEMIDTNLKGLLYLTRGVSPRMVARGSGHIINVASTAGKEVYPNGNVYCATKHAVDALTKAMRLDLHQHGVRVSQVAPAHVEETEFALVRFDGDAERANIYEDFKPLTSRDVAEAIYFISQQPAHVNILDVVLQGTQQPNSTTIDRSGRDRYEEEE